MALDRPQFNALLLRSVVLSGIEVISRTRLLNCQLDRDSGFDWR